MNNANRLIIFLHLPKTGGTTLWEVLQRQYGHKYTLRIMEGSITNNTTVLRELLEKQSHHKLLGGHVPYGVHTSTSRPYSYFTFLRDPVQWLVSSYYKVLRKDHHHLHEQFVSEKVDINEGMTLLDDNLQTRLLAGIDDIVPCTEAHLELAKQNLCSNIDVFGLLERYDESMIMLRRFYGWKMPFYVRKNVGSNTRDKKTLPEETLKIAQEHNALDIQLYQYAQRLFEEQVNRQSASFQTEVQRYKMLNPWWQRWYSVKKQFLTQ